MKKSVYRIILILLAILLTALPTPLSVAADTGPKEAVHIEVRGTEEMTCYITLLSQSSTTGPAAPWEPGMPTKTYTEEEEKVFWAMVEYEDPDGFYFLQNFSSVKLDEPYTWGYYPPKTFKVLLYFPATETFLCSEVLERYAFDTYYTIDVADGALGAAELDPDRSNDDRLHAYRAYNLRRELLGLGFRVLLTLAVELAIALAFGLRGKAAFLLIAGANALTQLLLNLGLNLFLMGEAGTVAIYILLELSVLIGEALFYGRYVDRKCTKHRPLWYYGLYAAVANATTLLLGLFMADNGFGYFF